ncbi:MAG: LapA family protein [Acidimicrobiia bacterium]
MSEEEPTRRVEYRGTGFYVGLAAILLFALILLLLSVQNTQEATISFLAWTFSIPLFAVAIGAALIAVILDELIGLIWRRTVRGRMAERAELEELRSQQRTPQDEPGPETSESGASRLADQSPDPTNDSLEIDDPPHPRGF